MGEAKIVCSLGQAGRVASSGKNQHTCKLYTVFQDAWWLGRETAEPEHVPEFTEGDSFAPSMTFKFLHEEADLQAHCL